MSSMGQQKMTTPAQLRAGRALKGLSQDDIAKTLGTSSKTVRRAEAGEGTVAQATIDAIRAALEAAGVEFIEENGGGPGVRIRKDG